MTVQEYFRAGELKQAIQALGSELRDRPSDVQRRTFLFELLCFAGEYGRAEKQLTVLADHSQDAQVGGLLYRSALVGERKRQEFFENKQYESVVGQAVSSPRGKLNGEAFETIEDADPRVGPRLEIFVAGEYLWLPFANVGSLQMKPPKLLRDLLWASADLTGSSAMQGKDFGEVLVPVLYPSSSRHQSDSVKLGRETAWSGDVPFGQKLFLVDGEKVVSFLEIRTLEFEDAAAGSSTVGSSSASDEP
jgi:type VI secretion system protein ImpE